MQSVSIRATAQGKLAEEGLDAGAIQELFDKQAADAKNHAYGVAEDIKDTQRAL